MNMKQMYLSSAPDISEFWRKDTKKRFGVPYIPIYFVLLFFRK